MVVALTLLTFVLRARRKEEYEFPVSSVKVKLSPERVIFRGKDNANRMVFFEGCYHDFDQEDLRRPSAEVLGKGKFGLSYKAILEDAATVVVKRLKEVGVWRRDFEQQVQILGRIKHDIFVELMAYYYSKDEKLMVYDYHPRGSLASLLHGNRGEDKAPLDWESRKRITLGTARGIAWIHSENGARIVHGNIESSDILLNDRGHGCVADAELMRNPNIEEELVEMLQIAMSCVVRTPDQRPGIGDFVRMIENVRRRDGDGQASSDGKSEGGSSPLQLGLRPKTGGRGLL